MTEIWSGAYLAGKYVWVAPFLSAALQIGLLAVNLRFLATHFRKLPRKLQEESEGLTGMALMLHHMLNGTSAGKPSKKKE